LLNGLERQAELSVGLMKNASSEWAFGGVVSGRLYALNAVALMARGRRWLGDHVAFEVEAGVMRAQAVERGIAGWGLSSGVQLNGLDYAALFMRHDLAFGSISPPSSLGTGACESRDPATPHPRQSLMLGGGTGQFGALVALFLVAGCASH